MGWIINRIREWFCEHDWELLNKSYMWEEGASKPYGIKWTYRCKKCGKVNIIKNY